MFRLFPKFEDKVLRIKHNVLIAFSLTQLLCYGFFVHSFLIDEITSGIFLFNSVVNFLFPVLLILLARRNFKLISILYTSVLFLITIGASLGVESSSATNLVLIILGLISISIFATVCVNWKIGLISIPFILIVLYLDMSAIDQDISNVLIESEFSNFTFIGITLTLVLSIMAMVISYAISIQLIVTDYKKEGLRRKEIEDELLEKNLSLNSLNSELEENMALLEETYNRLEDSFEKAKESDNLKSAFLENISHEVRTPLNAIHGFLGLIKEQHDEHDCQMSDLIDPTIDAGNQLLNTITDIIELAHIDANIQTVEKEIFNLKHYVKDIQSEYVKKCNAKNIEFILKCTVEEDLSEIYTDRWKVDQILNKLLCNALKFTFAGTIELQCHIQNSTLVIAIQDSGIGIQQEKLDEIFDKFSKASDDESHLYRGLGIGLTIAKELVECLDGNIHVESEFNKGSRFIFHVPVEIIKAEMEELKEKTEKKDARKALKVLIAEDDISNFYYLNALLKNESKINPVHVWNGQEAVDTFKEAGDFDLILMDIKMPLKDGIEAFREIKQMNPSVPVYAITAYALNHEKKKYSSMGFAGYLSKPVRKQDVLRIIYNYLD